MGNKKKRQTNTVTAKKQTSNVASDVINNKKEKQKQTAGNKGTEEEKLIANKPRNNLSNEIDSTENNEELKSAKARMDDLLVLHSYSTPKMSASDASKKLNVMIATPCYGAMVTEGYLQSIVSAIQILHSAGVQCTLFTMGNESLITRARNACVAFFLSADVEFTHLLFIDADIKFNPHTILRLLQFNKPVVAAAYPKKCVNFNKVTNFVKARGDLSTLTSEEMQALSLDYVINIATDVVEKRENDRIFLKQEQGFVRVSEAGTGFMMIEKETLLLMKVKYPELRYKNDVEGYSANNPKINDNFYLFFDTMLDPVSNRYLSEDYAFCHRCKKIGIPIWLDTVSSLTHIGTYSFVGNISYLFTREA